ncbi:MAG: DUF933 domain-containing protein [Thermodesulfobacteriota bacterium]
MKLGIIGLAGAGKSTIFSAITHQFSEPGTIIDNRIGTIDVPDVRVDRLSRMYNPRKTIYAKVEYLLPGIAGSKKDKNQFNAVRDCDALIHVVRNFQQFGLEPPNPFTDLQQINLEMIVSDLVVTETRLERLEKDKQRGRDISAEEQLLLLDCHQKLENGIPLRSEPKLSFARCLRGYAFISAKPQLVLFNNNDNDETVPEGSESLWAESMVIRGKLEQELSQMADDEVESFLEEFHISSSAMDRVIQKSYQLLGLISFFTVGEDEVRAWTIAAGTPAVEAAGGIHTDIQKGFIRAEVLAYDDLMTAGSFAEAKKNGTVRLEGRDYLVQNGDIINFRFNV